MQLTLISALQAFISLETVSSEVDADDNLFAFDSFSSSSRMIILPRIRFSSKELKKCPLSENFNSNVTANYSSQNIYFDIVKICFCDRILYKDI